MVFSLSMVQAGEILTFSLIKCGCFLTCPFSSPLQDALGKAAANAIQSLHGTTFTVGSICTTICEYFCCSEHLRAVPGQQPLDIPLKVSPFWEEGCFCRVTPSDFEFLQENQILALTNITRVAAELRSILYSPSVPFLIFQTKPVEAA